MVVKTFSISSLPLSVHDYPARIQDGIKPASGCSMILICENCNSRYLVPAHAIGMEGRRVRCTACGHEWYQTEDDESAGSESGEDHALPMESIPESVKPLKDVPSAPQLSQAALPPSNKGRLAGYAGAAAAVILAVGVSVPMRESVVKTWPSAIVLYDALGLETPLPGEGLAIDQVHATVAPNDKGIRAVKIEGRIINLKSHAVGVPQIRASLKLPDGKDSEGWIVPKPKDEMAAQEEMQFSTTYPEPSGGVKGATIRFVP
jgi:predicted Zn finger-like uncharacterized protein